MLLTALRLWNCFVNISKVSDISNTVTVEYVCENATYLSLIVGP